MKFIRAQTLCLSNFTIKFISKCSDFLIWLIFISWICIQCIMCGIILLFGCVYRTILQFEPINLGITSSFRTIYYVDGAWNMVDLPIFWYIVSINLRIIQSSWFSRIIIINGSADNITACRRTQEIILHIRLIIQMRLSK